MKAAGETHIPQSLRQVLDRWPIAERKHPQPASQGNQNLPTSPSTEDIARRLYQVYSQHAGWKDYRGEPLPSFDDMREATKGHWLHVAEDLCIHGLGSNANALRIVETWPLSLLDGRRLAPVPLDGGVAPAKLKTSQEKPRPP